MDLLYIDRGNKTKLTILAEALNIPEFSAIWKSDKSKDKEKALRELSYIYYCADYNSPYLAYLPNERTEKLKKDFKINKVTREIEKGIKKYNELQETPSMRFLKSATVALESMEQYFKNIDFNERDDRNAAVYRPVEISKCLKDCGGIMNSLEKLREKVKSEIYAQPTSRGGTMINIFEK